LVERLGQGLRLERNPFDAVQPYCQRAFESGGRPINVQLLPPARLMPRDYLEEVRRAAIRIQPSQHPHLLRVIRHDDAPDGDYFLEEAVGRHTLASLRRLRKRFTPAETVLILRQIVEGLEQAESLSLVPASVAPHQVFVEFPDHSDDRAILADDVLASTPLEKWPSFRLKLRAHPTALDFTQPRRQSLERWVSSNGGSVTHPAAETTRPSSQGARELALLTAYLLGGLDQAPGALAAFLREVAERQSDGGRRLERSEFLGRLAAFAGVKLPRATRPPTRPPGPKAGGRKVAEAKSTRSKPASASAAPSVAAGVEEPARPSSPARQVQDDPGDSLEAPADLDFSALMGNGTDEPLDEEDSVGFAEVLLLGQEDPLPSWTEAPSDLAEAAEDSLPEPAETVEPTAWLEGSDLSQSLEDDLAEEPARPLKFGTSSERSRSAGILRIVLFVLVFSLLIALLAAQLTGRPLRLFQKKSPPPTSATSHPPPTR
jgi:hypothetical protein